VNAIILALAAHAPAARALNMGGLARVTVDRIE
jgi:hypothetical protein